ncbi:serine hydrolase [Paenibacillus sp.]|uniref:serine hydrolase domain-containing protein n=1 Tax=Paenibacillus sp. TaxID=58172 RepID=UPI002D52F7CB|nr:serine hydrolase [Paenibacillus sp.]HZG57487.1 serine hydrolase [Paenibacillus sp.]
MDPAPLLCADEIIRARYPKLRCFLVAKDARLVFERYYGGADAATAHDLRSATKSVTAAVAACAGLFGGGGSSGLETDQVGLDADDLSRDVPDGGRSGPGTSDCRNRRTKAPTLGELFADRLPRAASDALRETTTLQLLAMTSGLHWQTGQRLGERFVPRLHRSRDWVRFALRLPVDPQTRGKFVYRSVDSHLLSAAVAVRTGRPAAELAQEALFGPLGIAPPHWEADPQGVTAGHVGLALTGRDLAKLGWLHAAGGLWEGRRLLPAAYVRLALTPNGDGLPAFGCYGGHWWIARAGAGETVRCALGHGGQLVFVSPERRLVAVFAADPKVSRWKHPIALYEQYVLAADGPPPPP